MDDIASFGYWLRRRRKTLDLTQAALAQQAGCSTDTIKKIERDERRPSRQLAELLADHLAIPEAEIARFIQMARGQFVTSMPSPLEVSPPPPFLATDEETTRPEELLFVARESELAQLDAHLTKTLAGNGRVLFVTGEAGSGKTTLAQEFADRAQRAHSDLIVVGGNCNAFTGVGDPYLPFREILGLLTGDVEARWRSGAISQEQAWRLWALIPQTIQALVTDGPELIDIFISSQALLQRATTAVSGGAAWLTRLQQLVAQHQARSTPANLQQTNLFEQYTKVLQILSHQQPILLLLDDLQWADTGSINLLFHLGRRLEGYPILVAGIYRPSDVAQGRPATLPPSEVAGSRERHPLEPVVNEFQRTFGDVHINLSQTEGRQFVDTLLDTEPNRLGIEFREALYQQTQGHALFTVEMLRGLQERGDLVQDEQGQWVEGSTLDWQTLPAKVEGVIGERMGRLPEILQEFLKIAAVEGELFTAEVIARVQNLDEAPVIGQLSGVLDKQHQLVRSRSTQRLGHSEQRLSQYRFRHILFQRYLYSSLDEAERAYLHESVGKALEQLYEGQVEEIAVQLARHFESAGLVLKAVSYLQQVGDEAVRLSAYQEAITHYIKALELLETLSDFSQHAHQELNLQLALGRAQIAVKGSAAPEVERAFSRARELSQKLEETPSLMKALGGLVTYYIIHGYLRQAHKLAEQCLQLALEIEDPPLVMGAHLSLGQVLLFRGELAQAQTYFEHGFDLYQPQQSADLISHSGNEVDPGVFAQRQLAWVKWLQGYPEQALILARQALALAQQIEHPFSIVGAMAISCGIHYFRREVQVGMAWAEETITLSNEHGFVSWKKVGMIFRGWAWVEQGQEEKGIEQMRQGLDVYFATGARSGGSGFFSLLAGAHLKSGQVSEGVTILEKALSAVEQTGERYSEAELYRLKGELLLMDGAADAEVEQQYLTAIAIARQQGARSWELRATVSLCRLWHSQGSQGKRKEAHQILAEIYNWFTEGFDTLDLKEAKALLEELSEDWA